MIHTFHYKWLGDGEFDFGEEITKGSGDTVMVKLNDIT